MQRHGASTLTTCTSPPPRRWPSGSWPGLRRSKACFVLPMSVPSAKQGSPTMNGLFDWALARAQEKSTWIGIVSLLSSAGVAVSPELQAAATEVGLAVSGLVLVLTREHTGPVKG